MKPPGHSEIARAAVPVLRSAAPGENFAYFYLGNWFTDYSQVRSPVDFAMLLITVRRKVLEAVHGQIRAVGAGLGQRAQDAADYTADSTHAYAGDQIAERLTRTLLGEAPIATGFRESKLGQYLECVVFIAGWVEFCVKGVDGETIPYDTYKLLFSARFTQYYAHEHLDRFPRNRSGGSRLGRRMYQYIEDDLEYVAELLTQVEVDWAAAWVHHNDLVRRRASLPANSDAALEAERTDLAQLLARSEQQRQSALVELGHALHAVEDFFAHSTFVDHAFQESGRPPQGRDPRRKWRRRLLSERDPSEYGETQTGAMVQPRATFNDPNIVTGSFDSLDSGASILSVARAALDRGYNVGLLTRNRTPTHDISQYDWATARTDGERQAMRDRYRACWAVTPVLLPTLGIQVDEVPREVQDSQLRMMEIDWELTDLAGDAKFSLRGGPFPPPGTTETASERSARMGILESLIEDAERNSTLTFPDGSRYFERVGSHTLIAKDGEDGNPGYLEAMNLAKRVSSYVAEVMTRNVTRRRLPVATSASGRAVTINSHRTDWLELARYFCGHPAEAARFRRDDAQLAPLVVVDGTTGFETGLDTLTASAEADLGDVVMAYQTNGQTFERLVIEGHTDSVGNHSDNLALSDNRANQVAQFLMRRGVPMDRIVVYGYGETVPFASNRTAAGRARNRRVEVLASFTSAPGPQSQWWRECMNDANGAHGHAIQSISEGEQQRRYRLTARDRLQREYDSYAVTQEARYGLWRTSGNGGSNFQRTLTLAAGQSATITQRNVDHGAVRVLCRSGRVQATLYNTVWSTDEEQESVSLATGEAWAREFRERSESFDQDNRVVIRAQAEAVCEVQMISYDYRPSAAAGAILEMGR